MAKTQFCWGDPPLPDAQLTQDERMIRNAARDYCQGRLLPRVQESFRHEKTDAAIFREMGVIGLLGPTIPAEYGGAGFSLKDRLRPEAAIGHSIAYVGNEPIAVHQVERALG